MIYPENSELPITEENLVSTNQSKPWASMYQPREERENYRVPVWLANNRSETYVTNDNKL